ncbi:2-oxoglutarate (2OG) and Fe(II)-dependent oxygenase superfamily protein [Melia azedarach]|uniref:2-oxoglutarate (2OG) and Fe(II)-dependent oxygenase superfamily protein n=1 Tax=Melia azedarach TaxID=155640 RepID=A0ACC1YHQ8_MELAZ|nr:2-oxoglutarate (2OG) and Fe(II)-dependent oxygenase superfamily protein [Melia azedarach]
MAEYPTAALHRIDLSNPDIHQSAALLKQACLDSGIFYVTNHGKLVKKEKTRGYEKFQQELNPLQANPNGHYTETYRIGIELPEDDPNTNIWPSADALPGWKETMQKYYQEALDASKRVARIIALALDVNVDFFDQPQLFGETVSNLYFFHYGGQVIDPSKEVIGAQTHTDFGLITLLATTDVLGLQICKDKYAKPQIWEYVPPLKGAFIVNIGDMLERFSNCAFRSTVHRVVFRGEDRYSLSFFLYPRLDCVIESLPTFKSEENPPKHPPVTCGEFLSSRFAKVAKLSF